MGSELYPNWIITSNFESFQIYDQRNLEQEPTTLFLKDLEKDYHVFDFLLNPEIVRVEKEEETSAQAGEIIGKIYDALLKEYNNPRDQETLKSLNILCVRLVFCFYAEDAGIFKGHNQFTHYLVVRLTKKDAKMSLTRKAVKL